MGHDYDCHVAPGFLVTEDEVGEAFLKHGEVKKHVESRFDQLTGERLPDVEVVDDDGSLRLVFEGKEYDDQDAVVEAVCDRLSQRLDFPVTYHHCGDLCYGPVSFVIGPGYDSERLYAMDPTELAEIRRRIPLLRRGLLDVGFDEGTMQEGGLLAVGLYG